MLKRWKGEKGAILVEASIYFPIVIFTVFSMIYFGMVKYQESILTFQVEKLAVMGGREVAYPGYEVFTSDGSLESSATDFKSGSDFSSGIEAYYEKHSEHLYREWKFQYEEKESSLTDTLSQMLSQRSFLTGVTSEAKVKIENIVIARKITVEATYGLRSPKFLNYVGVPLDLTLKTYVTQSASNPTELVRNIDLASDLIDFLLERFGVKDRVDSFLKKVEDIKDKIL
ncbi:MAG: hypothetical protein Q4E91_13260 [Lachnospiraceae bacterium]|nr:hypothetical protein [Lachnospiraceae bacterium]